MSGWGLFRALRSVAARAPARGSIQLGGLLVGLALLCAGPLPSIAAAQTGGAPPVAVNDPPGGGAYPVAGGVTFDSALLATPYSVFDNDALNGTSSVTYGPSGPLANTTVDGSTTVSSFMGGTVLLRVNGTFVYTPPAGFAGTDRFFYKLHNASGTSQAQAIFTVSPVVTAGAPPVAVADGGSLYVTGVNRSFNRGSTSGVLVNDTPNGATITSYGASTGNEQTAIGAATPTAQGGSVTLNADGSFTFTPKANFSGNDTFKYTLTNAAGSSTATATIFVDVLPAVTGTAPANGSTGVSIGTSITINFNKAIDTSNAFTVTDTTSSTSLPFTQAPADGNATSTFTLTPSAALAGGHVFTVTVAANQTADVDAGQSMAANYVFSFTTLPPPAPVNDPPGGGAYPVAEGGTFDSALLATPYSVFDNDTLNGASSVTYGPSGPLASTPVDGSTTVPSFMGGTVLMRVNGAFIYTPPAGFTGADRFFYKLQNASGIAQAQAIFTVSAAVPTVTGISPTSGPTAGATSVTITGTNFTGATAVTLGGNAATTFTVDGPTQISATTPAGLAGTASVVVTNPGGSNAANTLYTYVAASTVTGISPTSGSTAGGTSVTITGANFTGATAVTVGGNAATTFTVNGPTQITATTPAGTAGTASVLVTTPGGSNAANTLYTYVAPPTVTGISPTSGSTSGGTSVTITGANLTGTTEVKFGSNSATAVTVVSATSITATSPSGSAGAADVTVTTTGGTSATTVADQFTYIAPPVASSFTAGAVAYNSTGNTFSVAGHATNSPTGYAVGSATTANGGSVSINSAGTVTYAAASGFRGADSFTFTASNTGGTSSAATVTVPVNNPTLAASVTGTGALQAAPLSGYAVSPSGGQAPYSCNPTLVSGALPSGVGLSAACALTGTPTQTGTFNFSAAVTDSSTGTGGFTQTVTGLGFTVTAAQPIVSSISPTAGPLAGGTSVSITGTYFTNATAVTFGSIPATTFTFNSDSSITATAPAGTGTVDVQVTTSGGTSATSASDQFSYIPAPTVTGLNPTSGSTSGGTPVTITGTNFTGATAVKFGATSATAVTVVSANSITATSPSGSAGAADVTVTTTGGTSATTVADQFTYIAPPVASSFTAGAVAYNSTGNTFSVAGHATNSPTGYAVGSATTANGGSVSINSAGTVTYAAPSGFRGADSFTFTATNGGGTSSAATVTVPVNDPTLSASITGSGALQGAPLSGYSIAPSGGQAPYSCNTIPASGALPSGVSLSPACVLSGTPTQSGTFTISDAITDASTGTGGFTQTVTGLSFTVTAAQPIVSSISPTAGPLAGGTSVSITGTYFTNPTAVTFGSTPATTFTFNSDSSITATAPAGKGTVDVQVTTSGGTSATTSADRFTYTPIPAVSGVSPSAGPTTGGTVVTITGTGLNGASAVKFGSAAATTYTINSATQITATAPARTSGAVDVAVTAAGGTSAAVTADQFTYAPAPIITSVSPKIGSVTDSVIITGSNFTGVTNVVFGSNTAAFTMNSATQITATAPAGTGTVDIIAASVGGTNATSSADQFSYLPAPVVADSSVTVQADTGANPVPLSITGTYTSLAIVTEPTHGRLIVTNTGISYVPNTLYSGPDSFQYTASNEHSVSETATVTVNVAVNVGEVAPTLSETVMGLLAGVLAALGAGLIVLRRRVRG